MLDVGCGESRSPPAPPAARTPTRAASHTPDQLARTCASSEQNFGLLDVDQMFQMFIILIMARQPERCGAQADANDKRRGPLGSPVAGRFARNLSAKALSPFAVLYSVGRSRSRQDHACVFVPQERERKRRHIVWVHPSPGTALKRTEHVCPIWWPTPIATVRCQTHCSEEPVLSRRSASGRVFAPPWSWVCCSHRRCE